MTEDIEVWVRDETLREFEALKYDVPPSSVSGGSVKRESKIRDEQLKRATGSGTKKKTGSESLEET